MRIGGIVAMVVALAGCPSAIELPSDASAADAGGGDAAMADAQGVDGGAPADGGAASCGTPVLLGSVTVGGLATHVAVDGDMVYVVRTGEGVTVIDASDLHAMRVVLDLLPVPMPSSVAAANHQIVVSGEGGSRSYDATVFDVTDPSAPRMLYAIDGNFSTRELLFGDLLVDIGYGGVTTWRLGATYGTQLSVVEVDAGPELAAWSDGSRLVVASATGPTTLLDVSSPASLSVLATGDAGTHTYGGVAFIGDRVFVGGDTLVTLAVSGSSLDVVGSADFGAMVEVVTPWRDALLVSGDRIPLAIVDPASPSVRLASATPSGWSLALRGDIAFLVDPGPIGGSGSVLAINLCP